MPNVLIACTFSFLLALRKQEIHFKFVEAEYRLFWKGLSVSRNEDVPL